MCHPAQAASMSRKHTPRLLDLHHSGLPPLTPAVTIFLGACSAHNMPASCLMLPWGCAGVMAHHALALPERQVPTGRPWADMPVMRLRAVASRKWLSGCGRHAVSETSETGEAALALEDLTTGRRMTLSPPAPQVVINALGMGRSRACDVGRYNGAATFKELPVSALPGALCLHEAHA